MLNLAMTPVCLQKLASASRTACDMGHMTTSLQVRELSRNISRKVVRSCGVRGSYLQATTTEQLKTDLHTTGEHHEPHHPQPRHRRPARHRRPDHGQRHR